MIKAFCDRCDNEIQSSSIPKIKIERGNLELSFDKIVCGFCASDIIQFILEKIKRDENYRIINK